MPYARFAVDVQRPPEEVFALLMDLPNYRSWLPASSVYREITDVSERPARLGTTYVEKGSYTRTQGQVTELEPHAHISFHESLRPKRFIPVGKVDLRVRYTLHPTEQGTRVIRDFSLSTQGLLSRFQSRLVKAERNENERILHKMKEHLETH
jgi:carbon monoxide dehydrogenase subunit G